MCVTLLILIHSLRYVDEPSNHLDFDTIEALTVALREYEGAVVLVTHDAHVIESLGDNVEVCCLRKHYVLRKVTHACIRACISVFIAHRIENICNTHIHLG